MENINRMHCVLCSADETGEILLWQHYTSTLWLNISSFSTLSLVLQSILHPLHYNCGKTQALACRSGFFYFHWFCLFFFRFPFILSSQQFIIIWFRTELISLPLNYTVKETCISAASFVHGLNCMDVVFLPVFFLIENLTASSLKTAIISHSLVFMSSFPPVLSLRNPCVIPKA